MTGSFVFKETDITPDDILSAVFFKAWDKFGQNQFNGHPSRLQEIFHVLQKEFPMLKSIVYSSRGPKPYSPMLEEALSRMQLAGIIGRENPEYEIVKVKDSMRPYYSNFIDKKFTSEDREQIEKIAERFLSEVRQDARSDQAV